MTLESRIRIDRSRLELRALRGEVEEWLARRRAADARQQYASQLASLERFLTGAADKLEASLGPAATIPERGRVFRECAVFDRRVFWLRRVWSFFRDKLDQRDAPETCDLLRAADEVVWSCYHTVIRSARARQLNIAERPPPLPFIDAVFSPAAVPPELVPRNLKSVDIGFLRDHLNALPMPVLRIPANCVREPWWLVFVGHEVGHHVQYALGRDGTLVGAFRDLIKRTVKEHPAAQRGDHIQWGSWSVEVFADVFSVLTMGPQAAWAMVEFELDLAESMNGRRDDYPAPSVRLALLAETWRQWMSNGAGAPEDSELLRGLDPSELVEGDPTATRDLALVPAVADAALGPLPGLEVSLASLCGRSSGEYLPGGRVEQWTLQLAANADPPSDNQLEAAAVATSATTRRWREVCAIDADEERAAARDRLRERSLLSITSCRPGGSRASAAAPAVGDVPDLGNVLLGLDVTQDF